MILDRSHPQHRSLDVGPSRPWMGLSVAGMGFSRSTTVILFSAAISIPTLSAMLILHSLSQLREPLVT